MKRHFFFYLSIAVLAISCSSNKQEQAPSTMKDAFKDDFLIGAAINVPLLMGEDPKADSIVALHYNSIVPENCMKSMEIHPEKDRYFWDEADAYVKYGQDHDMAIIGHCLVWHAQLSPWFPYDENGNYVDKEEMKARMKDHIQTVVGRYKGKIKGWDVVNECIEDDGSWRHTPFYDILGEEFLPLAFEYAHEADPDAELYLNDYSMFKAPKREKYVEIIKGLKEKGIRIDGMGLQSHIGYEADDPDFAEYQKTIDALSETGVKLMITELDISALPFVMQGANTDANFELTEELNPFPNGLSEEREKEWNKRAAEAMAFYRKNADKIDRVTWWGTHDGMSWRNDWPINGRTDYPLPFDRNYNLKPFMKDIIETAEP
ncbi:MAG: endo-1,4-beta-xylanase [Muribaculaceae bacterium]|nr:endo-1,4-beta-xylanase [Muribaculaceae bacterium]